MPFKNSIALLGLLSTLPLIILYLIRPRPREVLFSSIQFLTQGEAKHSAVLRRLITDPLFWIQLFILIMLSVAAAGPYTVASGVPSIHQVIVVDVSASMEPCFLDALNAAASYIIDGQRTTIISAGSIPAVVLQEGSAAEAKDALRALYPLDISADLASALTMASSQTGAEGGRILLVSDFCSFTGDDPDVVRKVIEAGGDQVVFADVGKGGDNAAIVAGWLEQYGSILHCTALIRNFGSSREVPITVNGPGGTTTQSVFLVEDGEYYVSFEAPPGVSTISLDILDALRSDNTAYVYAPIRSDLNILYLGDTGPALASLRSIPGVIIHTLGDYGMFDVVVLGKNASYDGALNRYVQGGGNVVYLAYNTTGAVETSDLLPVRISGSSVGPAAVWIRDRSFAEGIHFDEIGIFRYLNTEAKRRSTTVLEANGYPVLSYWRIGRGTVVYNGLEGDLSDFYMRPEYPIFWYKMIGWLAGAPEAMESNRRTGEIIPFGEPTNVQTPLKTAYVSSLLLDRAGIYTARDKTIAANLFDPSESDLRSRHIYTPGQFTQGAGSLEKLIENDLTPWLIALSVLLLAVELGYIRWRREI